MLQAQQVAFAVPPAVSTMTHPLAGNGVRGGSKAMMIPGCIYHSGGLSPMRKTQYAQSTGLEDTEILSWECESPDCDGSYDNDAGYYRPGTGGNPDSMLSVIWAEETRCKQHKVQMLAIAQESEVITFQCPCRFCSNHRFVPRAALSLE